MVLRLAPAGIWQQRRATFTDTTTQAPIKFGQRGDFLTLQILRSYGLGR
jgi:hypothetical protein